ncbi:MAG: hypothetical protein ABIO65_02945, partial [Nitrospiria bacterium]
WGAVFGGLAVGLAIQVLLTLLGTAAGLSAVDPQSADPVGTVPAAMGIWTGLSMLIAAYVGGYVAARLSGLPTRGDGALHGTVTWGVTTLAAVAIATTAAGALLGGTFNVLGQGLQGATQGAASSGNANIQGLLEQGRQAVDQALPNEGTPGAGPQSREAASKAVSGMAGAAWWLFIASLLSLGLAAFGGSRGVTMEQEARVAEETVRRSDEIPPIKRAA